MAILYKKDKKTGKTYKIVVPDWDVPLPVINPIAAFGLGGDLSIGSHANDIIQSGLILYYDVYNILSYTGSNTSLWTDISPPSGSGINFVLTNTPTTGAVSISSTVSPYTQSGAKYLNFNGTNQSGSVGGTAVQNLLNFGTNPFTIGFWINPANWNNASSAGILDFSDGTNGWTIYDDGNYKPKLNARFGTLYYFTSSHSVTTGSWQNWVLTRDTASNFRWYYNGELDGITSSVQNLTGSTVNLAVARSQPWNGWYSGSISSIYIYNTALTSDQVLSNYNMKAALFGLPTYTASIG